MDPDNPPAAAAPRPAGDYLLPHWARRLVLYAGILIAYSQFVCAGLIFVYRYVDHGDGDETTDGILGTPYLVPWLFSPGLTGVAHWLVHPGFVVSGVVAAALGSAGAFVAWRARRSWRYSRALTATGAIVGAAATVPVFLVHAWGMTVVRPIMCMDRPEPCDTHPLNGLLEGFGAIMLPIVLYTALAVFLLESGGGSHRVVAAIDTPRTSPNAATAGPRGDYWFPRWARALFLVAGGLIAYSQFACVGLLFMYRYIAHDVSEYWMRTPGIFGTQYLVPWLFYPDGSIGVAHNFRSYFFLLAGIVLAGLGSAGALAAWRARRSWRFPRALMAATAIVGFGIAYEVFLYQSHGPRIVRPYFFESFGGPYDIHPLTGLLEAFGAIALPGILYAAVVVILLIGAIRESLDWRFARIERGG